jgi:hypothetical protein
VGITCALCHSTVDDSVMAGIGHRKDGWPNRDLNVGAIIALSPAVTAVQEAVYNSWGPGKYDPRYNLDGKDTPLTIPPAYGLAQVQNETSIRPKVPSRIGTRTSPSPNITHTLDQVGPNPWR